MSVRRVLLPLALIAAAVAIGGCNSNDATVRMSMTDGPVLGYDAVTLNVTQVALHRLGAAEDSLDVEVLSNGVVTVDLLTLQNGVFTQLAIGNVPEGQFDEVRLTVGTGSTITIAGVTYPLRVASGVVKVVCPGGFTAPGGTTTEDVVLDFDLSKTNFILQGTGEYHMTPVVHCMPQRLAGAIAGLVQPAVNAEVTATMEGSAGEVRTTFISDTGLMPGRFVLSVLAAGTYDVVIHPTTTGYADKAITGVVVTAGHTTDLGTITLQTTSGAPVVGSASP